MGQSKAEKMEADRRKKCAELLKKEGSETPFPDGPDDLKKQSSKWSNVDATNVHKVQKIIATLALADVPNGAKFRQDGGKGSDRGFIRNYVKFLIEDHASKKRKAKNALDQKEKKARGAFDLALPGLDQPAREDAWRRKIWNDKDKKVTLGQKKFRARTGPGVGADAFWDALKEEEKAAKVAKAKANGDVREMTREVELPDAWQPGQQGDGAMPFGAGVDEMTGAWSIGDEASDYVRRVVEAAAKRRGVSLEDMGADWARCLLKACRALEQKLRRHGMDNNGRCVTTALTTERDFVLLAVKAVERALARLVAELRETAPRDTLDVVALGVSNRVDVRADDVARDDAPIVCFGAAAGSVLGGGVASRGALPSGRFGAAVRRATAVSASAPASLGDVEGCEWEGLVLGRASRLRSASREPVVAVMTDTDAAAVDLDPESPTFLADFSRLASSDLADVPAINAALDERELHETPGGEGGLCLLRWGLMALNPLTGEGEAGPFIKMCEDIDAEQMKRQGLPAQGKFYAPKILHLALQKALLSGKLHFEDDLLTVFYCLYGKLFYALTFWTGNITWLKARDMGFDPTLIPLEVLPEEVEKMPALMAKRFPNGIVIKSSDDLLPILEATNQKFFDFGKCVLWALAFAAYYGADHPLALAALAAVDARKDDHERAASRVAACKKAIDALATGGGAGADVVSASDGLVVADGAAAPTAYVPFPSLEAALTAAVVQCEFEIRFAFPARKRGAPRMTQWYKVDDLVPVCAALSSSKDWNGIRSNHSWVFESKLYRAMEDAACASSAVFAGTRLTEIAGPSSLVIVFDPTKECKHDQTYTIWAGVDFEIMLPGGRVISKSEFLLQELEKYMARAAA